MAKILIEFDEKTVDHKEVAKCFWKLLKAVGEDVDTVQYDIMKET